MAEDVMHTRMYGAHEGWWNSNPRTTPSCFSVPAATPASAVSCSAEFTDMAGTGFDWAAWTDGVSQSSSDESPGSAISNSSLTNFQHTHHTAAAPIMDSASWPVSSPPAIDWSLPLSNTAREESMHLTSCLFRDGDESSLRGDEDRRLLNSHQNSDRMAGDENVSSIFLLNSMNQGFLQYQHHYESLLWSLLEPADEIKPYTPPPQCSPIIDNRSSLLDEVSPLKQHPLPFSNNNTSLANRSAASPNKEASSGLRLSSGSNNNNNNNNNVVSCALKEDLNRSNVRAPKSISSSNISAHQPALKKPRIETPSPLPAFKVRKEKLGDRITALQQLVSPFGKTDTASVLSEAIEYIKFLHDQVGVLSAPYLKNGNQMQHLKNLERSNGTEGPKRDLRSRGLGLLPVSSTFAVVSEIPFDFWAPTFGGSFN